MDKYITIEHPYTRVVLDMAQIHRRPRLSVTQWDALATAEKRIYTEQGMHAFTDVMDRTQDELPAEMWKQAALAVDANLDNDVRGRMTDEGYGNYLLHQTARRVARALAVLSFDTDILLK